MKLTRYTPSFDLGRVADFDTWLRHPFAGFPVMGALLNEYLPGAATGRMAADVYEDKDNYFARFELPGVKKEDIKVEVHDRLLTVSAERCEKAGEAEHSYSLSRSISVPEDVRADIIAAKLEDGVLTVTLPKQEQRKPRLVAVN